MPQLIICDYVWTILQLFFCVGHICDYTSTSCNCFGFHPRKAIYIPLVANVTNLVATLWNYILCILKGIIGYIRIYKCILSIYINDHITCVFNGYY